MPSGRADGTREQPPQLQTFLSWQEVDPAALTGRTVVVIGVVVAWRPKKRRNAAGSKAASKQ